MDRGNSELYDLINNGITGGPSIVFHRKAIKGKTRIRKRKMVEKVVGYDANSLYLWALDQPLPVGVFVHRRAENGFKPVVRDQLIKAYAWLDFLNDKQDLSIKHMRNNGLEKKVGPYPVDGWDASTGTVYQFHGCYFHGHQCEVTKNINSPKWKENRADYFKATQNTSSFIKESGHKLVEMWECEFSSFAKANPAVYGYMKEVRPRFYQNHKKEVTEKQILEGIRNETLFGMAEVDISVPDEWPPELQGQFSRSPYEHFSEMSPIFCTTKVPFDAVGPCMQEYIEKQNMSKADRTLLVGGMRAERILLATPLLVWYLEHGLKISKVHQVIEFQSQRCFAVSLTQFLLIGDSEMSQRIRKLREKTLSLPATRVTDLCCWIKPNGQIPGMSRVTKMPENK